MKTVQAARADEPFPGESDDPLLDCLAALTRLHGKPLSAPALASGLPLENHRFTPALLVRAAENHGYSARVLKRALTRIPNLVLPAILLLRDGRACVLVRLDLPAAAEVIFPETGIGAKTVTLVELEELYGGYCFFAQPKPRTTEEPQEQRHSRAWLWGTLWHFKRYYFETLTGALLINVLTLATSLFVMNVYDRVVPNNAMTTLWVLATGTLLAISFEFLARMLRGYFLDVAGKKADILLAGALFRQALALRVEARPSSAGAFASNLREFEAVRDFFTSATLTTLTDLPFVFLFAWVIALIGGPLAWVPLAAVPLVLIAGLIAQVPLAGAMQRHLRESSLKHGVLVEAVEGMETLKAFSAEGMMQNRWENYTALTAQSAMRSRLISSLVVNFSLLVQQGVTVVLLVWGAYRIGEGWLSVGGLVACTILSGRALAPLGQLAGLLTRYQHARAALKTLNGVMELPVERPAGRSFLHRPQLSGEIEFNNANFSYPKQKIAALAGVSFHIRPGEHVAILGRVGSGKSTLLKLMMGFYRPDAGAVLVDGADIQQIDPADLRRNTGYVAQDARLFFGTLRDNLALGAPLAGDAEILAAAQIAGVDKWANAHPLGYDLMIGERGEGLSGGQIQSVAIARTLLLAPAILLLDEPTSSMDHVTEQTFVAQFKTFARGRTLVLATHKPALLELVERLIVLDGGKVVADGPKETVLKALMRPVP